MYSEELAKAGLLNVLGGQSYNFRMQSVGEQIVTEVNRLMAVLPEAPEHLYSMTQTHSNHIAYCDGESGDAYLFGRHFPDTDALITDRTGIALLVKFADCTPVILYDPQKQVQGVAHSGWRGTAQKISLSMLEQMIANFAVRPEDVLAYIGPSIDQANYEVGTEIYEAFAGIADRERFIIQGRSAGKYQLDMALANEALLLDYGLKPEQILRADVSTYEAKALHSARREGRDYGLNAMLTMMV